MPFSRLIANTTGIASPQPFSQVEELKSTLALKPFRLQFISFVSDRGPPIVTEVEIQASALRRRKRRGRRADGRSPPDLSGQCREAFEREQRQRLVDIGAVVLAWDQAQAERGSRDLRRGHRSARFGAIGRRLAALRHRSRLYHVPAPIAPRSRRSHPRA